MQLLRRIRRSVALLLCTAAVDLHGESEGGIIQGATIRKQVFGPDLTELQKQFSEIVGDSFEVISPALKSAMENVHRVGATPMTTQASEMCDESVKQV